MVKVSHHIWEFERATGHPWITKGVPFLLRYGPVIYHLGKPVYKRFTKKVKTQKILYKKIKI